MASIESKYLSQKTPKEQVQSVALRYTDALYRYIRYTFSLDQMTTEDIVQELFLQLPKKLQKIDTDKPFEPRLYKVTHNFVLDRLRKHTIQTHKE
ncbi:sigma-70 family RNA polymerase sigma factor [bacterium]|nr:sigma-70 family RNA polymerase sigma factor [bacterium]